ncbi:SGNH/GDSL hydrolase family protein [Metabacillus arenae]|uniref:SGNH/GDSL hydrolase family protein n=1 Tax=Metabacillus arenae TaxID=2771434 RepID=A0A926NC82_9BACI|nr:SGNH/GDSL hydrolase family protein [Metabacillus arenae]MBD1381592.1 SGNH/GDSL hydrolase family protein [Metabacillus arenae]
MIKKSFVLMLVLFIIAGCSNIVFKPKPSEPTSKTVTVPKKSIPPEEFIPGDLNIVALGDSLTAGVGDADKNGGYVSDVVEQLELNEDYKDIRLRNYAVAGHKTTNLLNRLKQADVKQEVQNADLIFLTIGGNDMMQVVKNNIFDLTYEPFEKERTNFSERFSKIIQDIRKQNDDATIVYLGIYNPFKFVLPELSAIDAVVDNWNEASNRILLEDENARFVKIDDLFADETNTNLLSEDKFHPNSDGYKLMGGRVLESIEQAEIRNAAR